MIWFALLLLPYWLIKYREQKGLFWWLCLFGGLGAAWFGALMAAAALFA